MGQTPGGKSKKPRNVDPRILYKICQLGLKPNPIYAIHKKTNGCSTQLMDSPSCRSKFLRRPNPLIYRLENINVSPVPPLGQKASKSFYDD